MQAEERRHIILELLNARGRVSIVELSGRFQVSEMTVRRDLAQLESDDLLRRRYGGAERIHRGSFEPPYELRARLNVPAKRAIAAKVAAELRDGQTVVLDGGSTGIAIAEALRGRTLTVCVLNIRAAAILAESSGTTLMLPGGQIRHGERSIIGPAAEATLREFRFDIYVMTASAIDASAGMTEWNVDDAAVKRAALGSAARCLVACDSSKFGHTAFARIAGLHQADLIITDAQLDFAHRQAVQAAGVLLELA